MIRKASRFQTKNSLSFSSSNFSNTNMSSKPCLVPCRASLINKDSRSQERSSRTSANSATTSYRVLLESSRHNSRSQKQCWKIKRIFMSKKRLTNWNKILRSLKQLLTSKTPWSKFKNNKRKTLHDRLPCRTNISNKKRCSKRKEMY